MKDEVQKFLIHMPKKLHSDLKEMSSVTGINMKLISAYAIKKEVDLFKSQYYKKKIINDKSEDYKREFDETSTIKEEDISTNNNLNDNQLND